MITFYIVDTDNHGEITDVIELTDNTKIIGIQHSESSTWYAGKLENMLYDALQDNRCVFAIQKPELRQ